MTFGLDYVSGPPIESLKATGVTFVCRYIGYTDPSLPQTKILTPAEAAALVQSGISPVSNWEWYANRATEGYAAGVWDAQEAQKRHIACGGPPDRPIYFSVDADVDGSQTLAYFQGVASVIGKARTGAYGSYRVLQYLFNAGLIAWGWQTYAWSGGAWEPRAHIQQYQNSMVLADQSVDYDRSTTSDFGQWFPGGETHMGLPIGWSDDGQTLTGPNGVHIVLGFRGEILPRLLNGTWDAGNMAIGSQFFTPLLEASNPALGGGDQIIFLYGDMLAYPHDPQAPYEHLKNTVVREYAGQELAYVRLQLVTYYNEYKAAQTQLATLEEQLKQAAVPTGIEPATVKNRLSAIALASANGNAAIQEIVNQPL